MADAVEKVSKEKKLKLKRIKKTKNLNISNGNLKSVPNKNFSCKYVCFMKKWQVLEKIIKTCWQSLLFVMYYF